MAAFVNPFIKKKLPKGSEYYIFVNMTDNFLKI